MNGQNAIIGGTILIIVAVVIVSVFLIAYDYSGGTGSANNPATGRVIESGKDALILVVVFFIILGGISLFVYLAGAFSPGTV